MKQCSKCGETKPLTEYYKRKDSRDGYEGRCKKCANQDKYNPEQRRAISMKYYHAHKELCQTRCKTWKEKNREKYLEQNRKWHRENPAKPRTQKQNLAQRVRQYDLTVDEFENMKEEQSMKCAICHEIKPLVIDHDHVTGKTRGLLCRDCNLSLGYFNDSPVLCVSAAEYLRDNNARGIEWRKMFL